MISSFRSLDSFYEVLEELGAGATSVVYRVKECQTGRFFAAKCYTCEVEYAFHEICILHALHHPMVPGLITYGMLQGKLTLIQELVQGVSMQELSTQLQIPAAQVIGWMKQCSFFMAYLHQLKKPIYYCDFKPENVIVLPNGNLRVIDYGAAVFADEKLPRQGTPRYAAPEFWNSDCPIGVYTDLYTLGSTFSVLFHSVKGVSVPNRLLLGRILKRCLRPNFRRRYHSAREIVKALEKVQP